MNQYVSQGVFDRRVKLIEEKLKNIYDNDLLNRLQAEQEEFIKRLKEIELDGSIPDYFIADYNAFKANTLRIDDVYDANGQFDGSKIKPLSISTAALTVGQRSQQLSLTGVEFSVTPYSHSSGYYGTLGWSGGSMFHYGFINENSEPKVYTITSGSFALGNSAYYIYAYIANLESTTTTAEIKVSTNQIKVDGEGKPNDFPNGYYVQLGYVSVELDSGSSESSNRYYRKVDTTYGQTTINGRLITTGRIEGGGNDAAYFDLDKGEIGGKIIFKSGNNTYNTIDSYLQSKYNDILSYVDTNSSFVDAIGNLQDQIDGTIATWFYDYEPTLLLPPVANNTNPNDDWSTTKIKINHLGDLFYNTSTGYCYRFANVGTSENPSFEWSRVTDVDVVKALADAAKAQDTADHKRRVFITNENELPPVPYDVGDLWSNATYANGGVTYYRNCLLRCKTARASGATANISDWQDSSRATETADLSLSQVAAAKAELTAIQNGTTTIAGGMITNNLLELKNIVGATQRIVDYNSETTYYKREANSGGHANFSTYTTGGSDVYPSFLLWVRTTEQTDVVDGSGNYYKKVDKYFGGGTPGEVTAGLSGISNFPCYWSGGTEVQAANYVVFKNKYHFYDDEGTYPSGLNTKIGWYNDLIDFIFNYSWKDQYNRVPGFDGTRRTFQDAIKEYDTLIRYTPEGAAIDSDIPRLPVVVIDFDGFCKFGDFYIYNSQVYYNNASGFGHYALTLNGQQNGSGTSLGSFYAPTSAGVSSGQFLRWPSSGNTPIWQTITLDNIGDGNTRKLSNYLPLSGGTITNSSWGSQLKLLRPNGGAPSLYFGDGTYDYYIYPFTTRDNEWHVGQTINNHDYILLHSGNYNSYSPTLTGTGASGTWGISISGNAATATTATKLGTSTVGNSITPFYLSSGVATVCGIFPTLNPTGETAINTNDDLNTYTTPGVFGTTGGSGGSTVAASLSNCPLTTGFKMIVQTCGDDSTYLRQTINAKNGQTFVRTASSSNSVYTWGSWKHFPTSTVAAVGSTTNPVYVDANGDINNCTYSLSSTVNSGTANRLAYYTSSGIDDASITYVSNTKLAINSTSEPSYNLYVNGSTGHAGGHIYLTGANASISTGNTTQLVFGTSSSNHVAVSSNSNALIINPSTASTTGQVLLGVNGSSSYFISSGNFGIGTSSPAYKLDVKGDDYNVIRLFRNHATYGSSIRFENNSGCLGYFGYDGNGYYAWTDSSGNNKMIFKPDGTLGVNTTSPSSQCKLHVGGNIYATGGVTALQAVSSDKRLKKNIKKFNAKDIIDKLNPVSFEWNSRAKKLSDFKDGTNYGLIAQDSDNIIDNLVFDLPDGKGYKGIRYEKLIPILLQAVKEQQKEIDELKKLVKK